MKKTIAALTLIALSSFAAEAGTIRFFEGNNCSQNQKGECTDAAGQKINFKKTKGFTNDDARSVELLDVRAGAVIRVYDNPDGNTSDDYVEITVKRNALSIKIGTFNADSYENDDIKFIQHRNNGLDGRVSRVEVD